MKAKQLIHRAERRDDGTAVHLVVWELDEPLPPCAHRYKCRLAYVVDGACVVRHDNERGKGDHRHARGREGPYAFRTLMDLIADFRVDVEGYER